MRACMYVCMRACVHVCMHACMYACMHVCMYVCMYVCTCVCVCGTCATGSPSQENRPWLPVRRLRPPRTGPGRDATPWWPNQPLGSGAVDGGALRAPHPARGLPFPLWCWPPVPHRAVAVRYLTVPVSAARVGGTKVPEPARGLGGRPNRAVVRPGRSLGVV